MNKRNGFTKSYRLTYQIAAILVIVAALGLTFMYFYQKSILEQNKTADVEEEESTEASGIVEPQVPDMSAYETTEDTGKTASQSSVASDVMEQIAEASTLTLHFPEELAWPVEGKVILDYSMDKTVYFKTLQQYRYNPAVIIEGEVNQQVVSACDGKVVSILSNAKTGTTLTLDIGDGYQAVYGQLKEIPVATGTYVTKGQCLGYISEPSKYYTEEGANLYFQILKDGEPVNPQEYLEQ
jgi:septal ring factor EnvC (AmiA/AmiB activator)